MGGFNLIADVDGANCAFFFVNAKRFSDIGHSMAKNTDEGLDALIHKAQNDCLAEAHVLKFFKRSDLHCLLQCAVSLDLTGAYSSLFNHVIHSHSSLCFDVLL